MARSLLGGWLCAMLVVLAGCSDTTLLVQVGLAADRAQPDRVRVTLYGQGLLRSPSELAVAAAGRALPGSLFIEGLDAATPNFRVQIDGLDPSGAIASQGAAPVHLLPAANTRLQLTLEAPLADSDGDGVPDAVDDCPALPDADQLCGGADLGVPDGRSEDQAVPEDLAAADHPRVACPDFALFCDDFESGALTKWVIDRDRNLATSATVVKQPYNGSYAAEVKAPINGGDGNFASTYSFLAMSYSAPPAPMLAARAYINSPERPGGYENMMALFSGTMGWTVGADNSGKWVVTQDYAKNPDIHGTLAVPYGRWVCVELRIDYGLGHVQVYADGQLVVDGAYAVPTIPNELDVGAVRSNGMTASDLIIDDVVLAMQPIGCE